MIRQNGHLAIPPLHAKTTGLEEVGSHPQWKVAYESQSFRNAGQISWSSPAIPWATTVECSIPQRASSSLRAWIHDNLQSWVWWNVGYSTSDRFHFWLQVLSYRNLPTPASIRRSISMVTGSTITLAILPGVLSGLLGSIERNSAITMSRSISRSKMWKPANSTRTACTRQLWTAFSIPRSTCPCSTTPTCGRLVRSSGHSKVRYLNARKTWIIIEGID